MDAMVSMPFASSSAAFSTSPNRCICEHVGVMLEIGGGGGSDADQLAEKLVSPDRSGIVEQKREREEKEAPNGPKTYLSIGLNLGLYQVNISQLRWPYTTHYNKSELKYWLLTHFDIYRWRCHCPLPVMRTVQIEHQQNTQQFECRRYLQQWF